MRTQRAAAFALTIIGICIACASAQAFTTTWTDQFGETTYAISGPDAVLVGETATILLTVSDPYYPDSWAASSWSFSVDGVQQDGGFSIYTAGGTWQRSYAYAYPDPGSHVYTFRAQDLGHGGGHNYAWFEISGTTQILPATGACCFPDGSCLVLPEADCLQQGGAFQGSATVCDPNPCPQPPVACCFTDGHCEFVTADVCGQLGGAPQGYGTICDPNPCPQPQMACCLPDCVCYFVTLQECDQMGGLPMGQGTVCDPNPCDCPPPMGACCVGDQGDCQFVTEQECFAIGGVWQGVGTQCDPNPCHIVPTRDATWGRLKAGYR